MQAFRWVLFALTLFTIAALLPSRSESTGVITITGTVTTEGVECTAVRGDDDVLYTLAVVGVDVPLEPGMRIKVTGSVAEISNCQQGTTINVTTIEAVE